MNPLSRAAPRVQPDQIKPEHGGWLPSESPLGGSTAPSAPLLPEQEVTLSLNSLRLKHEAAEHSDQVRGQRPRCCTEASQQEETTRLMRS